jgi:uncharacterized protein (DUF885 family)
MRLGMDRRTTMATLGAATLFPGAAAASKAVPPCPLATPLDGVATALLREMPEIATYNGVPEALDGGALARRADDYSPAGDARLRRTLADAEKTLAALTCVDDPRGAAHLATARAIVANGTRTAAIPYGRPNPLWFSGHTPYLVTQLAGPHIDTVNVMVAQQSLSSAEAVDAWIEKLDAFPKTFAGVVDKLLADEAAGCRPPRILLEKALPVIDAFLAGPADAHPLIVALRTRTAEAGLDQGLRSAAEARAITALDRRARPAFKTLRAQVAEMIPRGRDEAGVWAQPQGDALYAANVRALGDTARTPQEIHEIGLAEVRRIEAEAAPLLARQGLTTGSVGERLAALARDPRQLFDDSDAGRAELLAYLRELVTGAERRQPEFLPRAMIPHQTMEVRRVPVASQAGAPGGYYDGPSLDGSRPGIYWINLRDMAAVPRMALPTLTYHEGVPGHHTQGAIAAALGEAPLLIRVASFNAYAEGWALYAERLMAELGAYRTNPTGDLGRLQDELFRAVRLVVDTGMHALRWTREKAITYMVATTGNTEGEVTAEIERYMAWPGQALGYKLGQLRLLELRADARRRKGARFDLRAFHGAVLGQGAAPLDIVAAAVARI